MGTYIANCWTSVMDSSHNPLRGLDIATQHYLMQILGWMWSMVFSLTFLSIYHFGLTWMAHLLVIGGFAMTASAFRAAEQAAAEEEPQLAPVEAEFSQASRCVWKMDSEA